MVVRFFVSLYLFIYFIYNVNFSESLGIWMGWFHDFYYAAFYYLVAVVAFVIVMVIQIVWQFYFKLQLYPGNFEYSIFRKDLVFFKNYNHNETLEFWWTIIPSIIIFFIALPALVLLYALEIPFGEPLLNVKVIGNQWYWSYEYTDKYNVPGWSPLVLDSYMIPDGDLKIGDKRLLEVDKPLVLPIETPIRMIVSSRDVIHSWAVPSLGVKMDAVPGRINQFWLYIPYQGVYYGQCSELCGANHGFMPICVYAVKPSTFVDWYFKKVS